MPEPITITTVDGLQVQVSPDEIIRTLATIPGLRLFGMELAAIAALRAEYLKRTAGPVPAVITRQHVNDAFRT